MKRRAKETYDAIKYASSMLVSKDGKAVQPCTGLDLKVYAAATFALTHK
ncbi:hypothetical protein SAMN05192589_10256 [Paracidovorax valerianellae]|uniref:Uncharacterized protein n=1 Tax=Paracidovorax valerianellae TaxID=187868 RepID=A0A1G6L4W5_9BURK|nr:hypothetical protein SAMN05192589_10256 [Paracidovorax valerianellae]